MSDMIQEINIIKDDKTIFDEGCKYIIPLYQRAYAWETVHIKQLIEDIIDINDGEVYYIGTLIVSKKNEYYEVVDGQQRLTTLYMLLSCLGKELSFDSLSFECRDKSNITLKYLHELYVDSNNESIVIQDLEESIKKGIKDIKIELQILEKNGVDNKQILEKLSRVKIYRIEVPPHTDLNRYFEIMNTRGEQLEQQDILKAKLMGKLKNDSDRNVFAIIWDACSDMSGYVQMHFNTDIRPILFGYYWNWLPSNEWNDIVQISNVINSDDVPKKISDFIKEDYIPKYDFVDDEEAGRVRFESIIDFRFFLLHVLKVFIKLKANKDEYTDELLDDKKLIEAFERTIENGVIKTKVVATDEESFAKEFLLCLLRTRFLFDKYIIKREYAKDNLDGEWSLKELNVSNKKAYYSQTSLKRSKEWWSTNEWRNNTVVMLQSAMRVSYTSPKIMHWIKELLLWLSVRNCENTQENNIINYQYITENFIKTAVKTNFLKPGNYKLGVNTPHIVFNYLDYLIWDKDRVKYKDFKFEFRNSVEHWYPQHPSTFERWDDVDAFGNLCIIQRSVNSKFSNMAPEAKKANYVDMISKGSLKLRLMAEATNDGAGAYKSWKDDACNKHGQEMLEMLNIACNPTS